ncbi:MAG: Calx-beta domain-containing protein, partial [Planctomycetota bacterium]
MESFFKPTSTEDRLYVSGGSATEGDSVAFQVRLNESTGESKHRPETISVAYSTADWDTTEHVDYESSEGWIHFPPGTSTQTVFVQTHEDWTPELGEKFFLEIDAPWGESTKAAGQIFETESAFTDISVQDVEVLEGDTARFEIRIASGMVREQPFQLTYETRPLTATDADYEPQTGSITITPWDLSVTIDVPTTADWLLEPFESFVLHAVNQETGQRVVGEGVIRENEANIPKVTFDNPLGVPQVRRHVTEGSTATLDVVLDRPLDVAINVPYHTVGGWGIDYDPYQGHLFSGVLTFAPGETRKSIEYEVPKDFALELTHYHFVQLTTPWGSYDEATLVILDEQLPTLEVSDVTVAGGGEAVFTIEIAAALDREFTVDYWTEEGSGWQFEETGDSVTFLPGETTKQVVVQTLDGGYGGGGYGGGGYGGGGYGGGGYGGGGYGGGGYGGGGYGGGGYGGGGYGGGGYAGIGNTDFFFTAQSPWGHYDRARAIVTNPGSNGVTTGSILAQDDSFDVSLYGNAYGFGEEELYGFSGSVLGNDFYVGGYGPGAFRAAIVDGPEHGRLQFFDDGGFHYFPQTSALESGDSFTYTVTDGNVSSGVASVTFDVYDTPPESTETESIYGPGEINTLLGQDFDGAVSSLGFDPDGTPLIANAYTQTWDGGVDLTHYEVFESGWIVFNDLDTLFQRGGDPISEITYTVRDLVGQSATRTHILTKHDDGDGDSNVEPELQLDEYTVIYNASDYSEKWNDLGSVLWNDTDGDSDLLLAYGATWDADASQLPLDPVSHNAGDAHPGFSEVDAHEWFSDGGARSFRTSMGGSVTIGRDGYASYKPRSKFAGTDSFRYYVSDGHGELTLGLAVVTVATPGWLQVRDDKWEEPCVDCIVTPGFNEFTHDSQDTDVFSGTSDPVHHFMAWNDHSLVSRSYRYRSHRERNIFDATLRVDGIGVLHNDTSPNGMVYEATASACNHNGVVDMNPDGSFTFWAEPGFTGFYTFQYEASDGFRTGSGTVTIEVHGAELETEYSANHYAFDEGIHSTHRFSGIGFVEEYLGDFCYIPDLDYITGHAELLGNSTGPQPDGIPQNFLAYVRTESAVFLGESELTFPWLESDPWLESNKYFVVNSIPHQDGDNILPPELRTIRYDRAREALVFESHGVGVDGVRRSRYESTINGYQESLLTSPIRISDGRIFVGSHVTYVVRGLNGDGGTRQLEIYDSNDLFLYDVDNDSFQRGAIPLAEGHVGYSNSKPAEAFSSWYTDTEDLFIKKNTESLAIYGKPPTATVHWGDGQSTDIQFDVVDQYWAIGEIHFELRPFIAYPVFTNSPVHFYGLPNGPWGYSYPDSNDIIRSAPRAEGYFSFEAGHAYSSRMPHLQFGQFPISVEVNSNWLNLTTETMYPTFADVSHSVLKVTGV